MSEAPVSRGAEPPSSPVSDALRLYGRHWRPLSVIALIGVLPIALLDGIGYARSGVDPFAVATTPGTPTDAGSTLSWVTLGLSLALYSLVTAACVRLVTQSRAGDPVDWRRALGEGSGRTVAVLLASVIVTIGVGAGLIAFILPGIWLAVAWSVVSPAVVIEGASPVQALKRSFALVRGSWWYTLGVLALGTLAAIAIFIAIFIPLGLLVTAVGDQGGRVLLFVVIETLALVALLPFGAALLTLLYFELRSREGGIRPGHLRPRDGEELSFGGFQPPTAPGRIEPPRSGGFEPPAAPGSR